MKVDWKRGLGIFAAALLLLSSGGIDSVRAEETWQKVPILSSESKERGSDGGEGCQWPQVLKIGQADPELMFYGTNTGGVYRSVDGGENWTLSMQGFYARGCNAIAIDPWDDSQVLAIGSSDKKKSYQGIYKSQDRGESWELVLTLSGFVYGVNRDCFTYDPSSGDGSAGRRCMRAYYSTPDGPGQESGLYRSGDGGCTWELINKEIYGARLMIHPESGVVYASREDGLYVSIDQGRSFTCLYKGKINSCDISWKSEKIYICEEKTVLTGTISGNEFMPLQPLKFLTGGHTGQIAVSPVNPERILLHVEDDGNKYQDDIYYSQDGGRSWKKAAYDAGLDFFPFLNPRDKMFAWSYTDENRVWSFGGDFIISSRNGGKNWIWDSAGVCGVLTGGKFRFNLKDPDIMFLGFQDYNGAMTTDGGNTWTYINMSGKGYSGHVYGGYAAGEQVLWGCLGDSWEGERRITISTDGGQTFRDTGCIISRKISGPDVSSYQSYNEYLIFFAGDYRSEDGGETWNKMNQCLQVYTHNPEGGHELYGCEDGAGYVLVSRDEGVTWSRVNKKEIPVCDGGYLNEVQVDPINGILYVAADRRKLYRVGLADGEVKELTENLPRDQMGRIYVNGIAVDYERGRIYVAGYDVSVNRSVTVLCSDDGGENWKDASSSGEIAGGDQIVSPMCLCLQPKTGQLWCSTSCYGILKLT